MAGVVEVTRGVSLKVTLVTNPKAFMSVMACLGPLTVKFGPALSVTPAIGGGTATTVPLWMMLPFGSGKLLMVQEFTEKMPIGVIMD